MFIIALITCKLLEYNVSEIQEDNTNRPMWKIRCLFLNEWCKWWHAITFRNLKLFCICFLKLITKSVLVTLNITIQYTTDIKAFLPHFFRKGKPLFYKFCNFQHLCELIKTDFGTELNQFIKCIKCLQWSYSRKPRLSNFSPHVNGLCSLNHSLILLKCSLSRWIRPPSHSL